MYAKNSPLCKRCFYSTNYYSFGLICNYLEVAGAMRGCPVDGCNKFLPQSRDPHEMTEAMRELWEQGLNDRQIGESLGVSTNTVNVWRRRAELPSQMERRRKQKAASGDDAPKTAGG